MPMLTLLTLLAVATLDDGLLTVAEASGYRATATHAEVMTLIEKLDGRSEALHVAEMGRSEEGKVLPLLILADPPVRRPADVDRDERLVVFALGNIHAGEVCGKEALMMLAREIVTTADHPLLDELVLLIAPIYNADGNDRMSPDNRPGQNGPIEGMGERANSSGLDLNRDYVKLESAEARALVATLDAWDPHLSIDTHTTNGSRHRYTLTYDAPLHPSSPADQVAFLRDELLPTVTQRLLERTGYDTFFYGNFNRAHTVWATYSGLPRFGANYQGLRGQMSILSEAYSYAPYRDRVLCTLEFCREILEYAAGHADEIRTLHDDVRRRTTEAGRNPRPDDLIALRLRPAAFTRPAVVKGYETRAQRQDGVEAAPRDHTVVHVGRFEPIVSVTRPAGYLVPDELDAVVDLLRRHGVHMERPSGPVSATRYVVRGIDEARRPFQGHRLVTLEVDAEPIEVNAPTGQWLVPTAQPLGTLAVFMLEPRSEDGVVAWGFLDGHLESGTAYPILRVEPSPQRQ